jgi:hypothetical protein
MDTPTYEGPRLTDYGDLQDLTASNTAPTFVDVPEGTPSAIALDGDPGGGMS